MAVSHIADSTIYQGPGDGSPNRHSCVLTVSGGSSNVLVGFVMWNPEAITVSSLIWDPAGANQSFTSMGTAANDTNQRCQGFYLINPTAGATKDVQVTMSSTSTNLAVIAAHFAGVDQVTPIRGGTYTTATHASTLNIAITSQADDMTVSAINGDLDQQNAVNQTLIGHNFEGAPRYWNIGAAYAAGAATVTHTWTNSYFSKNAGVGASLAAAAAGATNWGRLLGQEQFRLVRS